MSGSVSADALSDRLGIKLPEDRDYATVAGFALSVLKHLPEVGERFRFGGWQFEIVDMDGRKIDKLLVSEAPQASGGRRAGRLAGLPGAQAAELAELLLEAVDVAAGEIAGLLDHAVAGEAALERPEPLVEMGDLGRR